MSRTGRVPSRSVLRGGVGLGHIAGIHIVADWSLLIIFALIAFSLAGSVFPSWHPGWTPALSWAVGLGAAVLFLASVLGHELSHAIVGRMVGVKIRRITLFMLGGMAQMEGEPRSWRAELAMAAIGPITSLALGLLFSWLAALASGPIPLTESNLAQRLEALSPLATLLIWLGPINILLGVFNLVPGFPLDGGRVLRALIWGVSGDMRRATRVASRAGQAIAWLMIGTGLLMAFGFQIPVLGSGLFNGLWLMFIGWFLNSAAVASYRQMLMQQTLEHVPVSRLMQTNVIRIGPNVTVSEVVEQHMISSGQRVLPVERQGELLGLVSLSDCQKSDRSSWDSTRVADIMTPIDQLTCVAPGEEATQAIEKLASLGVNQLPVVEDHQLLGLLRREDVLRWLATRAPLREA